MNGWMDGCNYVLYSSIRDEGKRQVLIENFVNGRVDGLGMFRGEVLGVCREQNG